RRSSCREGRQKDKSVVEVISCTFLNPYIDIKAFIINDEYFRQGFHTKGGVDFFNSASKSEYFCQALLFLKRDAPQLLI
ncbi:MAG: hypothetical protein KAR12_10275, partial [Methylococcales bacterium]|nr:hypothetical protein [Methylococcales bacterium]